MTTANNRFQDKVVIVTGAAGDIGRETARRFAAEGARVEAVDFDADSVAALAGELTAAGLQSIAEVADVTREADVKRYVERACAKYGGTYTVDGGVTA